MKIFILVSLIKETHTLFLLSSNVPFCHIGAELLRIASASNNPESFSTTIKPLTAHMRQGVSTERINCSKFC